MSPRLDEQSKMAAVGEVLSGMDSLSSVARRYGISIGYLSILSSRARRAIESKSSLKQSLDNKNEELDINDLAERLQNLEQKFNSVFK